jgi:hypothetical protein
LSALTEELLRAIRCGEPHETIMPAFSEVTRAIEQILASLSRNSADG